MGRRLLQPAHAGVRRPPMIGAWPGSHRLGADHRRLFRRAVPHVNAPLGSLLRQEIPRSAGMTLRGGGSDERYSVTTAAAGDPTLTLG